MNNYPVTPGREDELAPHPPPGIIPWFSIDLEALLCAVNFSKLISPQRTLSSKRGVAPSEEPDTERTQPETLQ